MSETPAQYKQRLFHNVGERDPLTILRETPQRLRQVIESQTAKQSDPSRWSPAQIVAHFAEGELVFGYRLRMTARNSGVAIQAYDQNVWVEDAHYLISDVPLALEMFTALRKANIALVESLSPEALQSFGVHAERGKETVVDLIRLAAGHDLNHLAQL